MNKRRYQSERLVEKKKKRRIIISSLSVLGVILIVWGISFLSSHKIFHIEEVQINELRFINSEEVDVLVKGKLEGKYIWLFSRSNSVIFPRSEIEKGIKEKFTSVKRVDTDFRGFHTIKINIIEYDPVARWCDTSFGTAPEIKHEGNAELEETDVSESSIPDVQKNTGAANCYFLNENGVVFVEEPELHTGVYVNFFGLIEGDPLGKGFATKNKFKELLDLTKLIRRLDVSAKEVWTKTGEVYAIVTESGAKLYIDDEDDVVSIFRNLETVISQDAINKAQFENIEYIDLRFGNRVFYKLK